MLIRDIALYIDGLGLGDYHEDGFDTDNNVFLNMLPQNPDNVICIYDTGGSGNDIGFPEIRRNVQVFVRNESALTGSTVIWGIYNALIRTEDNGFLFINNRKMLIKSISAPVFIGKDTNGLFEYSANFSIITQSDI